MRFRSKYYWVLLGYCLCFATIAAMAHALYLMAMGFILSIVCQIVASHCTKMDEESLRGSNNDGTL